MIMLRSAIRRGGLVVGAGGALAAGVLAAAALALGPVHGNFNRAGVIAKRGAAVMVSGPISCPTGDTVRLRATVSQLATGAVAQGFWSKSCAGSVQHWDMTAKVTDSASFTAGCAHGTGLAIVSRNGKAVTASQWLSALTLTAARKASAATPC